MIYSIYKGICKSTGKMYVGYTKDFRKRLNTYRSLHCKDQPKLYGSLKEYGFDNHAFEVIYQSKDGFHTLHVMEPYFIRIFDSYKNGLNCEPGGNGWIKITKEYRRKRSDAAKKQWSDPKMRKKMIKGSTKCNKDPEKRSLISEKAKERWNNPEFKQKKRFAAVV